MDLKPDHAELQRLERALRRIPRRQREIFLAVRIDDLSYADIAERTGLTIAKVERLFARSLRNFSRNLNNPYRFWWRRW